MIALKARAKRFWQGMAGLRGLWCGLGFSVGILMVSLAVASGVCDRPLADAVRYAGLLCQLAGICSVAWGLVRLRRDFGRPSIGKALLSWARGVFGPQPEPIPASADIDIVLKGFTVTGDVRVPEKLPEIASLEERVAVLEENHERLHEAIDAARKEHNKETDDLRQKIVEQDKSFRQETDRLNRLLEGIAIGGLNLEVAGLVVLVVGTVLGSVPAEIAAGLEVLLPG